uniref:Uncharacterized protein n=1 Tax=Micromonas pusilla TaxID=38833 RepID=A0A7R9Y4N6_MICPS
MSGLSSRVMGLKFMQRAQEKEKLAAATAAAETHLAATAAVATTKAAPKVNPEEIWFTPGMERKDDGDASAAAPPPPPPPSPANKKLNTCFNVPRDGRLSGC